VIDPSLSGWPESGEHRILFPVERPVWVDMLRVFPGLGSWGRQDQLAMWIKAGGLRLEPWMPGRQVAWIRRADGGWLARVCVPATSTNRQACVTLQLWVEPAAVATGPPWGVDEW
jgi:hypothetical protein